MSFSPCLCGFIKTEVQEQERISQKNKKPLEDPQPSLLEIIIPSGGGQAPTWMHTAVSGAHEPLRGPSSPEAIIGVQGSLLPYPHLARVVQPVWGNHHKNEVRVVVVLLLLQAPQISTAMIILTVHTCQRKVGWQCLLQEATENPCQSTPACPPLRRG